MSESPSHERVNDILLGPLERPALRWLSKHMPERMTPDTLTLIGIVGSLMTFGGYWASNASPWFLWLASFGLVVNWFGDSLDGTIARYRRIERPKYGYFVDHAVDGVSETLVAFGLGLSPYVSFNVAAVALVGYLLLSIYVYLTTYVRGVFQISYGRFGPTEVRAIIIGFNALLFFGPIPYISTVFGTVGVYDLVIGALAAVLIVIFVVSAIREARNLAVEDTGRH
ncbi:MAG: CDP-alcohol phosphatidyltransferase family protein [Actinobacteria bacterium]|nr:CDP-alcohol phosphatidyltransferase family protein [Actinomycetota bacterium]